MAAATAEQIVDAVKDYLDATARAHTCPGFDCITCAVNSDRYRELVGVVESALKQES